MEFSEDAPMKPPRGILLSPLEALKFHSFHPRGVITRLTFFPGIQDSRKGGVS